LGVKALVRSNTGVIALRVHTHVIVMAVGASKGGCVRPNTALVQAAVALVLSAGNFSRRSFGRAGTRRTSVDEGSQRSYDVGLAGEPNENGVQGCLDEGNEGGETETCVDGS